MSTLAVTEDRRATLAEIFELRYDVLRAGLPRKSAEFQHDDNPQTWHVGTFWSFAGKTSVLCCASFMPSTYSKTDAFQLRGMATHPDWQSIGFGRKLLDWALWQISQETRIDLFWCNARKSALGFYEKMRWSRGSGEFEIPTAGPHYIMWRQYQ